MQNYCSYLGLARLVHVLGPALPELLLLVLARRLHGELVGEDVAELGAVAVPSSGDLLLLVVEVGGCEEVAEDHGGHVHLLVLVHLDGDALAVVEDLDLVLLGVDVDLDGG